MKSGPFCDNPQCQWHDSIVPEYMEWLKYVEKTSLTSATHQFSDKVLVKQIKRHKLVKYHIHESKGYKEYFVCDVCNNVYLMLSGE